MDGSINFSGTLAGSIAGGGDVTDVKVRDSQETTFDSVVNEQGVAEIDLISYVRRNELTQAIENIENSIDNVEQLVDTKQNIPNYSTEQVIGKWIDGKPLYRRTWILSSTCLINSGAWYTLNIDVSFIKLIVSKSFMETATGANTGGGTIVLKEKSGGLTIGNEQKTDSMAFDIITLEYTKTTD